MNVRIIYAPPGAWYRNQVGSLLPVVGFFGHAYLVNTGIASAMICARHCVLEKDYTPLAELKRLEQLQSVCDHNNKALVEAIALNQKIRAEIASRITILSCEVKDITCKN